MPRKTKTPKVSATAPGQPYGVAGEQKAAMDVVPIANTTNENFLDQPINPQQATADLNPVGSNPEPSSGLDSILQAAIQSPTPELGAFSAPSERPEETFQNMQPMGTPSKPPTNPTIEALEMMARNMGNDPALLEMANMMRMRGY